MSESECKTGPYPGQEVYPESEEFGRELADKIRRSEMSDEDPRERAEKDACEIAKAAAKKRREDQLKRLRWAMEQKDHEKLLKAIEDIVRRVLVEENTVKTVLFK